MLNEDAEFKLIGLQKSSDSDPICSSAGCGYKRVKPEFPMDYPVPNFGVDHDMVST